MRWQRWTVAGLCLIAVVTPGIARRLEPKAAATEAVRASPALPAPLAPAATKEAPAATTAAEPPRAPAGTGRLSLTALDREPKDGLRKVSPEALGALRKAAADSPRDRARRFDLVRALMLSGDREGALAEARAWREKDAYDLVVVRLLGDLYAEMGEKAKARRAYSAVVELLPGDPEAQRALATVLKQNGDLEGARERLLAATAERADDVRMAFELADVAQRLGRAEEAADRFRAIIAAPTVTEAVRYPARQRLTQIDAAERRAAVARGDGTSAERLGEEIQKLGVKGGVENDVKIYLTWDTDRTDVDLWVTTPAGELVNYAHRTGSGGEALFDDVTTGYGPESFTAKRAQPGRYLVEVNYYGTQRQTFSEARGEVVVILGEGTPAEEKHVLPYRLFKPKQTVRVAAIEVKP
jgi:Ca-activated chloride channel family protein